MSGATRAVVIPALRDELDGKLIYDHPDFTLAFFDKVGKISQATDYVFERFQSCTSPLYVMGQGWTGLTSYDEATALRWLSDVIDRLRDELSRSDSFSPCQHQRLALLPNHPVLGSSSKRKLDVAFVRVPPGSPTIPGPHVRAEWKEVLTFGEQKKDPTMDNSALIRDQVAGYVREVFGAQAGRRFVLGFTLCEATMRFFEFDRIGGVFSTRFDIHADGRRFVKAVTAFYLSSASEIGFDPSIDVDADGNQFIDIEHADGRQRIILERPVTIRKAISSRGTTVWKAILDDGNERTTVAVKDS